MEKNPYKTSAIFEQEKLDRYNAQVEASKKELKNATYSKSFNDQLIREARERAFNEHLRM